MTNSDEVSELLERLAHGDASLEVIERLKNAARDPAQRERLVSGMLALGLGEIAGEPLRPIGDYYIEKPGSFELRWPLPAGLIPFPFGSLDRKTQFIVLFQEWTRRELDGNQVLAAGNV